MSFPRCSSSNLRETQHTPVSHTPDIPFHPQMFQEFRIINCWARGFLGYAKLLGSVGKVLEWIFHIIGDKLINPIVRVYIPIIRIPYLPCDFEDSEAL